MTLVYDKYKLRERGHGLMAFVADRMEQTTNGKRRTGDFFVTISGNKRRSTSTGRINI